MRTLTVAQAIREALREEMLRDEAVFLMGEDIGIFGGPFGVTTGLIEEFGEERIRDTPISETGFIGAAVGAALTGMRPVVEVQYSDFITCGMDQVVNQAAKMRFISGGQLKVPLVIRAPVGATGRGAQHAQSPYAWFMHCPGLKVVAPSGPYDAKGLLKSAIRDDNPVMFFEHKFLYGSRSVGSPEERSRKEPTEAFAPYESIPTEEYMIPLGKADIKKDGKDVTVIANLLMVHKALRAANVLHDQGIDVEVIDLRSFVPLDKQSIIDSVKKTGRAVVVDEGARTCGIGAEIAAVISEEVIDYLDAAIVRVTALDTPVPFSPVLESRVIPDENRIAEAIKKIL